MSLDEELYDCLDKGHDINDESFRLELFKLLFYVVGDNAVCDLGRDNPDCTFTELHNEFFTNEAMSLLISTAIKGRLYDDYYDSIFKKDISAECGELRVASEPPTPLLLREAFNKILHSRHYFWGKPSVTKPNKNFVSLYGKKGDKIWEAILDLKKYIHHCTKATLTPKDSIREQQEKKRSEAWGKII